MVVPLAEHGRHVGKFVVVDHALVPRRQDAVGHLSDLRRTDTIHCRQTFIVAAHGFCCHPMLPPPPPPHGLTITSYQREHKVVEATVSLPAIGQADAVVVLSGEPALEGCVGGPLARIHPVDGMVKHFYFETSLSPSIEVCTCYMVGGCLKICKELTHVDRLHI